MVSSSRYLVASGLLRSTQRRCMSNSGKVINTTLSTVASVTQEVSNKQDLYLTDPVSLGSVFFLPNGAKVFNKLVQFMKLQQQNYGFNEVITPIIYKKTLWEQSGHWENYKDDMFRVEGNDCAKEEYGLKPMNCPGHCVIFKRSERSYNDLPLRYSDFSPLHRNEASGGLSGLSRVRKFHQDDGHIFCTEEQVAEELRKTLQLVDLCYTTVFPMAKEEKNGSFYRMHLSTRPSKYVGDLEVWNRAESVLKSTLEETNMDWSIKEGDGAFYGPKIDIMVKDHTGKSHQVATIQLDFQLPERFNLKYRDKDGSYKTPIMIHRAVFGSVERFMAMLLDSNGGNWPFWLNPHQCIVIPVNTTNKDIIAFSNKVLEKLRGNVTDSMKPVPLHSFHFNADIDSREESVSYRTREAINKKYSYIVMIGEKEVEQSKVALRSRDSRKVEMLSLDELYNKFCELEQNYK
ncbi:HCL252Cp [Eremothecium sinecaudum]|uniref:threonine--tRNA ligase n=1 Tax=Eremothecium sinecaudum TaxID=45286 RepID=A0A0X8HR39_9SACH|nr:HCL252Cp [Eremothecium sinecaudum]AMD19899.1 HCL252Cp [Eremothecium sinecaudum]